MVRRRTGRHLGAALVLVAGLLLVAALLTPWYANYSTFSYGPSESHFNLNTMYYLGPSWLSGTVQFSCNYSPCPAGTSYSSSSTSGPGVVAEVTFVQVAASCAFAIIAGVLGVARRRNWNRTLYVNLLAVTALCLGVAATAFYSLAFQLGYGGPWGSFWGSSTGHVGTGPLTTNTWGPFIGWYLAVLAVAVLLAGSVMLGRTRRDLADPVADPTDVACPR